MSNLVEHAKRELDAINCDEPERSTIIKAVEAFAEGGWSGSSAAWGIETLRALLQFKNLGPLTSDPKEWMDVSDMTNGHAISQSRRNPEAFSLDGGKTYYLLSEREAYEGKIGTYTGPDAETLLVTDEVTPIHISSDPAGAGADGE